MAKRKRKQAEGWRPKALERLRPIALHSTERFIAAGGGDRHHADPGPTLDGAWNAGQAMFPEGLPSFEQLAAMTASHGGTLTPDDYGAEVSHLVLSAHRLIRWVNFGMPVYQLDPGTSAMLLLTDVDRIRQGDLVFPFPTFLIVLEPGSPLYMDAQGSVREVRYVWVHSYQDDEGVQFIQVSPYVDLDGVNLPTPFRIDPNADVEQWTTRAKTMPQEWGTVSMTDRDRDAIVGAVRLVVSLVLHLQDKPARPSSRARFDTERFVRQDLPLPTDWIVSPIQLPTELADEIRKGGPQIQGKLTARHIVRGHWRWQPYGEGRALRRPVRVEPYWRGVGPHAVSRVSKVKEDLLR